MFSTRSGVAAQTPRTRPHPALADACALVAVLGIALAFRLYAIPSIPAGIHGDESTNGIDILFTLPQGLTPFLPRNNGREALFIYLQAALVGLMGPGIAPLRLASVMVGTATVAAVYWLGRLWHGRLVALLAALGLATSFWHVAFSRIGFRAVGAPLVVVLALACLWKATTARSWRWAAAAGAVAGLGLYVYLSLRFLPILVAAWFLASVLTRTLSWRQAARLAGVAAVTFLLIATPLVAYFTRHPEEALVRVGQVSVLASDPQIETDRVGIRENVLRNLGVAVWRGEPKDRFNLPGRPAMTTLAAPWFVLGLAITLVAAWRGIVRPRRVDGDPDRLGVGYLPALGLLAWIAVFMLPECWRRRAQASSG